MINLTISNLRWITGLDDDPSDQCAHGQISFRVNNTTFVSPEDGRWTVTAAALYLLRTLNSDHNPSNSVAEDNFLFPHCGFDAWPNEGKYKVICPGCTLGIDIQITHRSETVVLSSPAGTETVSSAEWKSAVLDFAEQVLKFYQQYSPKQISRDELDRRGWQQFWAEWEERAGICINQYLHHRTENIIRTPRLTLIAATTSLLAAELESPAKLGEFLEATVPSSWPPGEYDRSAMEFFHARLAEDPKAVGWYSWYAVLRTTADRPAILVGAGGFFGPATPEGVVEIGYSMVPEFQSQGLATELVCGLIERAFSTPGITHIIAHTTPSNPASIKVLERCGFSPAGPGREPRTVQYSYSKGSYGKQ